jgi:hypothetical protein
LLPEAKKYFFDQVDNKAHVSITNEPSPSREADSIFLSIYSKLEPRFIEPKRESILNCKPHFVLAKRLFKRFVEVYNDSITYTADTTIYEDSFMFREIAFALISLASCSTNLIRLVPDIDIVRHPHDNFVAFQRDGNIDAEFASTIFSGFHLPNVDAGSAPGPKHYWMSKVLIYPVSTLRTEELMSAAIAKAVEIGRSEGFHLFDAIITSIMHVALVRVTKADVQHTKRLRLVDREVRYRGFGNETYDPPKKNSRRDSERLIFDENDVFIESRTPSDHSSQDSQPEESEESEESNSEADDVSRMK